MGLLKRKLIADAGSTKVEWALIGPNGTLEANFTTPGFNSLMAEREDILASLAEVDTQLREVGRPEEIRFYGAGCVSRAVCEKVEDALRTVWQSGTIAAESDLVGAARALFGRSKGIACILGTGSNSCLYDGEKIASNVPSLGYILGDEGSGASLGKRLINDAFKGHLPAQVREKFLSEHKITLQDILDMVYRKREANKFLASLVPFLSRYLWNPYVYSLVLEEFRSFIRRNIAMYPGAHTLPISFIGSIAVVFEKVLREAAAAEGYKVAAVVKSPVPGLISYHTAELIDKL